MAPDDWQTMTAEGLALAPVAGIHVVIGTGDAPAFFTDELFVLLQATLPGTPVTAPDEVYARLEEAGPNAHSRLRSLQRQIVQQEPIDAAMTRSLAGDLGERHLLVVFMDEGSEEGIHRTNLDDFQAFNYSMAVHSYPTDELHGLASGFLIDLVEGRQVWTHDVEYQSEGLATANDSAQRIIDRTRSDAASRLCEALARASPGH